MKTTVLCLVCLLVLSLFLYEAEGTTSHQTEKRGCRRRCWRLCLLFLCYTNCKTYCGKRGLEEEVPKVQKLPFVPKFETYDQDNDGFISEKEFIKTNNMEELSGHATVELVDKNGDGKLDREEFDAAPLVKGPVNDKE